MWIGMSAMLIVDRDESLISLKPSWSLAMIRVRVSLAAAISNDDFKHRKRLCCAQ
jgi:hypothetical protein